MTTRFESALLSDASTDLQTEVNGGLHRLRARPSADRVHPTPTALRAIGIVGLLAVGVVHLLNLPATMRETPYIGWLTIAPVAGSLLAAVMLVRHQTRAWTVAAAVTATTIIAFVISRTVGLPMATDDIGNWTEPLGLVSLFLEGGIVCAAASTRWPPWSATAESRPAHRVAYQHRQARASWAATRLQRIL